MNTHSLTRHPVLTSLLIALALCTSGAGCGQGDLDGYDSVLQGLTQRSVGPIGTSAGTMEGTLSHREIPVKKIKAYATSTYIYGLELIWGDRDSEMYGSTNGLVGDELDFTGDPVKEIKYHVDATGYLRGIRLKTVSGTPYPIGYLNVTQLTAFSNVNAVFTDLVTYKGTINNVTTIWGATFHYTTP